MHALLARNLQTRKRLQKYDNELLDAFTSTNNLMFTTVGLSADADDKVYISRAFEFALQTYKKKIMGKRLMAALVYNVVLGELLQPIQHMFFEELYYWISYFLNGSNNYGKVGYISPIDLTWILSDVFCIFSFSYELGLSARKNLMLVALDRFETESASPIYTLVTEYVFIWHGLELTDEHHIQSRQSAVFHTVNEMFNYVQRKVNRSELYNAKIKKAFNNEIRLYGIFLREMDNIQTDFLQAINRGPQADHHVTRAVVALLVESSYLFVENKIFQPDMLKIALNEILNGRNFTLTLLAQLFIVFRENNRMSFSDQDALLQSCYKMCAQQGKAVYAQAIHRVFNI